MESNSSFSIEAFREAESFVSSANAAMAGLVGEGRGQ
jgi:hypothetical protein